MFKQESTSKIIIKFTGARKFTGANSEMNLRQNYQTI